MGEQTSMVGQLVAILAANGGDGTGTDSPATPVPTFKAFGGEGQTLGQNASAASGDGQGMSQREQMAAAAQARLARMEQAAAAAAEGSGDKKAD